MAPVNISRPAFEFDPDDPDGFRAGMFRLGTLVGASATGMSVYELPPGQALCPYHYECGEEEWLLVLEGRPTVRLAESSSELQPWDVVWFAKGPEGAHQVRNDGAEPARILMFSDRVTPSATVYPDSDKVAVWTGNPDADVIVRRSSAVGYFDGEGA